jgi:hypothetical protein
MNLSRRSKPGKGAVLQLNQRPSIGLLKLVVSPAKRSQVARAGRTALAVGKGVIKVATSRRSSTRRKPAGSISGVDEFTQGFAGPVATFAVMNCPPIIAGGGPADLDFSMDGLIGYLAGDIGNQ